MNEMTVKICGLQTVETIEAVAHLPIDQIGFLFAKSRRQVTPAQAGQLIRALRERSGNSRPLTVGVFVNPTLNELKQVMAEAPLDVVQLHGAETAEFAREVKEAFGVQIYKVVSIGEQSGDGLTALEPLRGIVDAILLDTHDPAAGGGTGKTFNWTVIPAYKEWVERAGSRLIVAGGLDPDNVAELIRDYRPHGLDVSSGVETNGSKDPAKIKAFTERVKGA